METKVLDPIKESLKYVDESGFYDAAKAAQFKEQIEFYEEKLKNLLPVEKRARDQANAKIEELKIQLKLIEAIKLGGVSGCKRFHPEIPFSWRDKDGMPRLAIFSTESATAAFEARYSGDGWQSDFSSTAPQLSKVLEQCFNDVREKMYQRSKSGYRRSGSSIERTTVTAAVHFAGVIPDQTKEKIRAAQKVFGSQVFLVAETPGQWSFDEKKEVEIIPRGDPLVIGVLGDTVWLIDAFDLTTLENMAKSEFTT